MGLSIDPRRLERYRDIAGLLLKHGRADLVLRKDEQRGTRGARGEGRSAGLARFLHDLAASSGRNCYGN